MLQDSHVDAELIGLLGKLIDADYYGSQLSTKLTLEEAARHYLTRGWVEGIDPCALFSGSFYVKQIADFDCGEIVPLLHYVAEGHRLGLNPHPLFDTRFYLSQLIEELRDGMTPLEHFLCGGFQRYNSHILFDSQYYCHQLELYGIELEDKNPVIDYLATDHQYSINPHPLFDTEYYLQRHMHLREESTNPLEHFLANEHHPDVRSHILFDNNLYRMRFQEIDSLGIPVIHFLLGGYQDGSCHVLFDREYYASEWMAYLKAQNRQQEYQEFCEQIPIVHYLREGYLEGVAPTPLFDPCFFKKTAIEFPAQRDPLSYYMTHGVARNFHPAPFFDNYLYDRENPDREGYDPLTHYQLSLHAKNPTNPFWGFDFAGYEQRFSRIFSIDAPPPVHYLDLYSDSEREYHVPFVSHGHRDFLYQPYHERKGITRGVVATRVLLTVHDFSRTGAPLIALNILKRLTQDHNIDCVVFALRNNGPLRSEFESLAKVIDCSELQDVHNISNLSLLVLTLYRPGRTFAICNSTETVPLSSLFSALGIPIISLCHEFPSLYGFSDRIGKFLQNADRVIFPSSLVRDEALDNMLDTIPDLLDRSEVFPQGLLDSRFLEAPLPGSDKVLHKELELDPDTFVIMGCGYLSNRKGCDLFLTVAQQFLRQYPEAKIAFVWVGGEVPFERLSLDMVKHDVHLLGLEDKIFFIGGREDTKPYFDSADVFLMCSRKDPFPCVVLEAMATGTPTVLFDEKIGSIDILEKGGGIVVDLLDTTGMAAALGRLHEDVEYKERLAREAQALVAQDYDFDQYVEGLLDRASELLKVDTLGSYCAPKPRTVQASKQRPKIFLHTQDWQVSGVNTTLEQLTQELCRLGWDATLLISQNIMASAGFRPRCPHRFLTDSVYELAQEGWEAFQHFLETSAPCIVLCGYDMIMNAAVPAFSDRVGFVSLLMSDHIEYYESANRLGRYYNRLVAVSNEIAAKVTDLNPLFADKTVTIINSTVREDLCLHSRSTRLDHEPIRLIYTGRIEEEQKRMLDYLEVVDALEARGVDYRLTIIGSETGGGSVSNRDTTSGKICSQFNEQWGDQIAAGKIILTGRLEHEQVIDALSQHDVFLHLAAYEGFPLSIVEAMALGCVPIVRDIESGIPELVTNGENGIIITDIDQMVDEVIRIKESSRLWQRLSRAARKTVAAKFTLERIGGQYDELLQSVSEELLNHSYHRPEVIKSPLSNLGDVLLPGVNYIERDFFY